MNRAIGMVIAIENTPHGLCANARTTTSASTAITIMMITGTPMSAATPAVSAELVANHLPQGTAAAPGGDP